MPAAPTLDEHFAPSSLWGLLRTRHPYDFRETYQTLLEVYGYQAFYVNLGLWDAEEEPGRALTFHVADALELPAGGRLVDAGSGLGQAAVDLCRRYALGEVWGLNLNRRQVGFAQALAAAEGLQERVRHQLGDACELLKSAEPASVDGVLALECIGHFARPEAFLRDACRALRPGGRLAFCLNVARRPLSWSERLGMQLSYGFVPASLETWRARLRAVGFAEVEQEDLSERVLRPMCAHALARLEAGAAAEGPWLHRRATASLLRRVQRSLEAGRMGYARVVARRCAT